jgi:hypothetical protein
MTEPKFFDQGRFGCVHKPRLYCKGENILNYKYPETVSKLLTNKDFLEEISEFEEINKIDPNNIFHIPNSNTCKPSQTSYNKSAIQDCKHHDTLKNHTLILMEDGGDNVDRFVHNIIHSKEGIDYKKKAMEKFWREAYRLLIGIRILIDNELIHSDLKAQNVVYDVTKERANIIDFGKLQKFNYAKESYMLSDSDFKFHWSHPFESFLTTLQNYLKVQAMNENDKLNAIEKYFDDIVKTNLYMSDLFKQNEIHHQRAEFTEFILIDLTNISHDDLINKHLKTFDIYGMGLCFLHAFNKTSQLINNHMRGTLSTIIASMLEANVFKRINIDRLLFNYELAMSNPFNFDYIQGPPEYEHYNNIEGIYHYYGSVDNDNSYNPFYNGDNDTEIYGTKIDDTEIDHTEIDDTEIDDTEIGDIEIKKKSISSLSVSTINNKRGTKKRKRTKKKSKGDKQSNKKTRKNKDSKI